MKEKALVSVLTLATSLVSYHYAKRQGKDVVPYVMIGGFLGAWAGEFLIRSRKKKYKQKK